jgi:hypothetical protein
MGKKAKGRSQATASFLLCAVSGKLRHSSRGKARRNAEAVRDKQDIVLDHYYCHHCKGWHLGNTPATRTINLNRKIDTALAADNAKRKKKDAAA